MSGAILQRLLSGLLYPTEKIIIKSEEALGLFGYGTGFVQQNDILIFIILSIG